MISSYQKEKEIFTLGCPKEILKILSKISVTETFLVKIYASRQWFTGNSVKFFRTCMNQYNNKILIIATQLATALDKIAKNGFQL